MNFFKVSYLLLLIVAIVSCSKKSDSNSSAYMVNVRLTDNPFNAEEVNVDIRSVQLKYDDDDNNGDDDHEWYTIDTHNKIYNLLDLQNDVNILLASGPYPHDRVHEIRLLLGDRNSIKIGGILYPLTVPSGSSSGFKIKINKTLVPGPNDILIDFDAGLSIHETGNGKFMLRPVLKIK
jgi:hypothetical protein